MMAAEKLASASAMNINPHTNYNSFWNFDGYMESDRFNTIN